MKRSQNLFAQQTANGGPFYSLVPVARKSVSPGTTFTDVRAKVRMQTSTVNKFVMTDALLTVHWFYVPYRLVWDQWSEFIAGDTAQVPSTQLAWGLLFEHHPNTWNHSVLGRRAYKLIYNQFFGQFDTAQQYVVDNDGERDAKTLRIWEQFGSALTTEIPEEKSFDIDGLTAIPLNEFARQMRDARSVSRTSLTGNKYVDLMRTMGVELDWRVQMAPEYLGSIKKVVKPSYQVSNDPTALDERWSRWQTECEVTLNRRMSFAEHGVVFGLAALRPAIMNEFGTLDDILMRARDRFYMGNNDAIYETLGFVPAGSGGAPRELYGERFINLLRGTNLHGAGPAGTVPWFVNVLGDGDTDHLNMVYPNVAPLIPTQDELGYQVCFTSDVTFRELTPLRGNVV